MTRKELEDAIRAACDIAEDNELYVFGSQAILGQYPNANEKLRKSIEVDVSPKNNPEAVTKIAGALGENSMYHNTKGFYVDGVSIETAILPEGWQERTIKVEEYAEGKIGLCVEAHDLAASKLLAFREKDTEFVRTLILEGLIDICELLDRIKSIKNHKEKKEIALRWVEGIANNF